MKKKSFGDKFLLILVLLMIFFIYKIWSLRRMEIPLRLEMVRGGDTLVFQGGNDFKMVGVKLDGSGSVDPYLSEQYLSILLENKNVWVEFDDAVGNQKPNYVWVWVGCESSPKFWESSYVDWVHKMRGTKFTQNPVGCKNGVLVNEQIIKQGWSEIFISEDYGRLKYEDRLFRAVEERL